MKNNLSTMVRTDLRRMGRSRLFYILVACALLIPVVMVVMMSMMDGTVTVDPQTGAESVMEGPENAWQSIGTLPSPDGAAPMGGMDVMAMCNINMMFMAVAVFICLFISEDFRSGYAKNLFTLRAKKGAYVVSKTLMGFLCGLCLLAAYFVGALLGGVIAGLSFDLCGLGAVNLVFCMVSKAFLMLVFVSIDVLVSVAAKQKAWLCLCGSLGAGMLLFMTVSMVSPLNATVLHAGLCLVGGVLFALGLGAGSKVVLNKTALV